MEPQTSTSATFVGQVKSRIADLEADLAEARAQIAANWDEMGAANRKLQTELFEARALIAAKDAALRELAAILKRDDDNNAIGMIIADIALSAPAREAK